MSARSTVNVDQVHEAARRIQATLPDLPPELESALSESVLKLRTALVGT